MKYISEKEAWELCAKFFSLPLEDRYDISEYADVNEAICGLLCDLYYKSIITVSKISLDTLNMMEYKIDEAIRIKSYRRYWLFPPNTNGKPDKQRVEFCLKMAEECEK